MATVTYSWVNRVPAFLVNTTVTAGTQTDPFVLGLQSGQYDAFWTTPNLGLDFDINLLNADGTSAAGGEHVQNLANNQSDAVAVQLTGGQVYSVWTDSSGTSQIKLSNGVLADAGAQTFPDSDAAIAALSNGGFVVTWTRDFGSNDLDVDYNVFNSAGSSSNGQNAVDLQSTLATFHSSVAGLSGGGFVVAWEQTAASGGNSAIWLQRYDNSGTALGGHFQISGTSTIQTGAQIKALPDGGFVVAWTTDAFQNPTNIQASVFNADGTTRKIAILVDSTTSGNQDKPSIAVLSNGDFVVSWTDETQSGYQAFDSSGNRVGPEYFADTGVVKDSITSLSGTSNGGLVASVFESSNPESAGSGDSIRSSINELIRTTIGTSAGDILGGDQLRDIMNGKGLAGVLIGRGNADTFVFDSTALGHATDINDYDSGNTGSYSATEGDVIDISALVSAAYIHGSGQPVSALVRAANVGGNIVLQVDTDGAANGTNWITVAQLEFVSVGNTVSVLLDATSGAAPVRITADTPPSIFTFGGGDTFSGSISENTINVPSPEANDPDPGNTLTYSIAGGADAASFTINSANGQLSFITAPDFEHPADSDQNNSYIVTVRASDGNQFDDQTITYNVTNVNEPPVITSNGGSAVVNVSIPENSTFITTVHATDPDAGATLTYSITGVSQGGLFHLDSSTGALSFNAPPDFENPTNSVHNNSFFVSVGVSDGSLGAPFNQTIFGTITDVNDNAPVITTAATHSISEDVNTAASLTSTDADTVGTNPAAFSITGGADAALFSIADSHLQFINAPDFENPTDTDHDNSYVVDVTASDGVHAVSSTLTINVTDATDGAPLIAGDASDNVLSGTPSNDTIDGLGGNDTIFGGAGADVLFGEDGNDTLVGNDGGNGQFLSEGNTLNGGAGDDTILGAPSDNIDGGAGHDTLQAVNSNPWTIDLGAASIEYMLAGFGDDHIDASTQTVGVTVFAGGGNNTVIGSAFDDSLWGGVGNDTLTGGDGNDLLFGDLGADSLSGGAGNDTIYADSSDTHIDGGAGTDALYWAAGVGANINLAADSIEFVQTLGDNDTLTAAATNTPVVVFAGAGNDTITGGSGADFLWGEAGNDTIVGGAGDDTLVGGAGADKLTGGPGTDNIYGNLGSGGDGAADTYVFDTPTWGTDFVYDFDNGIDKFDLTALHTSFAALTVTDNGPHAQIAFAGNLIVVVNAAGQIDPGDFLF